MNQSYWDQVCANYDSEILSVWDRDFKGIVRTSIDTIAAQKGDAAKAADIGCGTGKFLPVLSESFIKVEACDYSTVGLEKAQERCCRKGLDNVHFHQLDLALDPVPFEPVDFVLCVNVLIMPSFDARMRCWRTVTNQVRSGGHLLLVVPSLESILMQQHLERTILLEQGNGCEVSLQESLPDGSTVMDLHQGVHRLEGCRTKHYLQDELLHLLDDHEFEDIRIESVSYQKSGESESVWDWVAIARRKTVCLE